MVYNGRGITGSERIYIDKVSGELAVSLEYIPNSNINGERVQSFDFLLVDDKGNTSTNTATMYINISPVNDVPVSDGNNYRISEDSDPIAISLVNINDIEDGIKLEIANSNTELKHGRLDPDPNNSLGYIYTPNSNEYGIETLSYSVIDTENGISTPSVILIEISSVNDLPIVSGVIDGSIDGGKVEQINTIYGKLTYTDIDGDIVRFSSVSNLTAQNGYFYISSDGGWAYKPNVEYEGVDYVMVKANDNNGGIVEFKITFTVIPFNHAPTVPEDGFFVETVVNTPVDIDLTDGITDEDGDQYFIVVGYDSNSSENGIVSLIPDKDRILFNYIPATGFVGIDYFDFIISDSPSHITDGVSAQQTTGRVYISVLNTGVNLWTEIRSDYSSSIVDEEFTIEVEAINIGLTNGEDVQSKIYIPEGVEVVDIYSTKGSFHEEIGFVVWDIGSLMNSEKESIFVTLKAKAGGDYLFRTGIISLLQEEYDMIDNTSEITKQVLGFEVPSAITPNGNGINDYWVIKNTDSFNTEVVITTTRGVTVFKSNDYQNDWDANSLPAGTYFYHINITANDGQTFIKKGYLTVVRRN